MNMRKFYTIVLALMTAVPLSFASGPVFAGNGKQLTPVHAAKREMVRKQQEQRITPEKRKAAAEALKAERLRVYKAKQAVKQSSPASLETK